MGGARFSAVMPTMNTDEGRKEEGRGCSSSVLL